MSGNAARWLDFELNETTIREHARAGARVVPDEAIYGPASQRHGGWIDHPMPYYSLLAGICKATNVRRALEIGTHFGGATLSILAGMRSAVPRGHDLCVVTVDPSRLNETALALCPEIHRVDEAMPGDRAWRATRAVLRQKKIDLVFIDALKSHEFVGEVLLELTWRYAPRLVVLDDVCINPSMRDLWRAIKRRVRDRAIEVSAFAPEIRASDVGLGIVQLVRSDLPLDVRPRSSSRRFESLISAVSAPISTWYNVDKASRHGRPLRELKLLKFLGANQFSGRGVALDCGGAGALAMAEGLRANRRRARFPARSIHVLVPLSASESGENETLRSTRSRTQDTLALLGKYAGGVNIYVMPAPKFRWTGLPLELIALHGVRSWRSATAMLLECLQFALPGMCCLVTSDTIRRDAGGLLLALAMLMDDVYPIFQLGATVVFGVRAHLPVHRLDRLRAPEPALSERLEWLDRFASGISHDELAAHAHLAACEMALDEKDRKRAASQFQKGLVRSSVVNSPSLRARLRWIETRVHRVRRPPPQQRH